MLRKWFAYAMSAAVLISIAGAGFSLAQDEENELEKLMEKVNKHSNAIKKGTRNLVNFKKSQKDIAKNGKELAKLAKDSKTRKEALSRAKNEADPQKKWDELSEAFISSSQKFSDVAGKAGADQGGLDDTKKAWSAVNTSCTNCHQVFRVDESNF
jgi:cytochrome c556